MLHEPVPAAIQWAISRCKLTYGSCLWREKGRKPEISHRTICEATMLTTASSCHHRCLDSCFELHKREMGQPSSEDSITQCYYSWLQTGFQESGTGHLRLQSEKWCFKVGAVWELSCCYCRFAEWKWKEQRSVFIRGGGGSTVPPSEVGWFLSQMIFFDRLEPLMFTKWVLDDVSTPNFLSYCWYG